MENLNDKGLYLDELQKLRVLDPEITAQVKIWDIFIAISQVFYGFK